MPRLEPTSVKLHQTGNFWRTLYRLSYGSNFYPDVASNVGLRTSGLKEEELVGVVERLAAGLRDDVTELNLDLAEEVVASDPVHVEHFQHLAEDWNTIFNAYGAVVVAQVD